MSLRRSSRPHKPPKWVDMFEPCDTSTPIHANHAISAIGSVADDNDDGKHEVTDGSGNSDKSSEVVIYTGHEMTHPKSKKSSGASQTLAVPNRQGRSRASRSRSRSRSRKSTPTNSVRRTPLSEPVVSPALSEISDVLLVPNFRRSTRLAGRLTNGLNIDNNEEERKNTESDVVSSHNNNTSFFRVDLLSSKPRLMTFLQISMLLVYIIIFYKSCIYFGADKYLAHLIHKWH